MRTRAFRRHQEEKKRKRVRSYLIKWFPSGPSDKRIAQAATTPHPCSCQSCGNPRKHWKDPTMQEKRFAEYCQCED